MATVHFTNGCRHPFDDDYESRLGSSIEDDSREMAGAVADEPQVRGPLRRREEAAGLHLPVPDRQELRPDAEQLPGAPIRVAHNDVSGSSK